MSGTQCPLYPQKRTSELSRGMSAMCQKQTFRAAERTSLFDHFAGTADCHAGGRSGHSFRMCL